MSDIQMSPKEPAIDALLEGITGRKRDGKLCMTCGSEKVTSEDFRNGVSLKEFTISGMCQVCQDSVFGED